MTFQCIWKAVWSCNGMRTKSCRFKQTVALGTAQGPFSLQSLGEQQRLQRDAVLWGPE